MSGNQSNQLIRDPCFQGCSLRCKHKRTGRGGGAGGGCSPPPPVGEKNSIIWAKLMYRSGKDTVKIIKKMISMI